MPAAKIQHDRASVLARARREYAALDALIGGLTAGAWTWRVPRTDSHDPWTVKDAIVHIVHWKEHTARVLRVERRPPELRRLDAHAVNHLIYERWRDRPIAEVVAWHHAVHEDVVRTLETIPEERIGGRIHSTEWPLDFDGHSADHGRRDIEAALGR